MRPETVEWIRKR